MHQLSQIPLPELQQFFADYIRVKTATEQAELESFQRQFEQFKVGYRAAKAKAETIHRQQAPDFNIFQILGVETREDKTHSAFLAHLFNPAGSHGQKGLFLQSFLNHLNLGHITVAPHQTWRIQREKHTAFGVLDILISCNALGFICVIENKIYAGEMDQQIKRYADWLITQKACFPQQQLIYLTLDGRDSETADGAIYHPLSYAQDIRLILDKSLPQIEAVNVRESVIQYIGLIKILSPHPE